jgi:ferritin-like metal-binding protein YciE
VTGDRNTDLSVEENDMAELTNLHDALVDEICDLYSAEKQLVKALPKMAKAASSDDLREAIEHHLEETENQIGRLEQIFDLLDEKPRAKHCAGIAGIIEEGADVLKQDAEDAVLDACIIAAAQRAEHYEMAAYGTVAAWAEALDLPEVAQLLRDTLDEEKAADKTLTELAESGINAAAEAGGEELADEDGDEEDDTDDEDAPAAKASGRKSSTGR